MATGRGLQRVAVSQPPPRQRVRRTPKPWLVCTFDLFIKYADAAHSVLIAFFLHMRNTKNNEGAGQLIVFRGKDTFLQNDVTIKCLLTKEKEQRLK